MSKNDAYPHIITSVCTGISACQYGINPTIILTTNNICYRDVIEQSILVCFNFNKYFICLLCDILKYSQKNGTKYCPSLVQILWTLYYDLWGFWNFLHKTVVKFKEPKNCRLLIILL